jgi:hypothetical protein
MSPDGGAAGFGIASLGIASPGIVSSQGLLPDPWPRI